MRSGEREEGADGVHAGQLHEQLARLRPAGRLQVGDVVRKVLLPQSHVGGRATDAVVDKPPLRCSLRATRAIYDEDAVERRHAHLPQLRCGLRKLGIANDKFAEQSNSNLLGLGYDLVIDLCQLGKVSRDGVTRVRTFAFSDSKIDDEATRKAIAGAVSRIAKARVDGKSVLVHCEGGHNRSASVVAAWALSADALFSREELVSYLRHEQTTQSGDADWCAFVAPTHMHLFELLSDEFVARMRIGKIGGESPRGKRQRESDTTSSADVCSGGKPKRRCMPVMSVGVLSRAACRRARSHVP